MRFLLLLLFSYIIFLPQNLFAKSLDEYYQAMIDDAKKLQTPENVEENARSFAGYSAMRDLELSTPLLKAIQNKNIELIIEQVSSDKLSVNAKDNDMGLTPLMLASIANEPILINLLLEYGADINAADNDGWTALMWAAQFGQLEAIQILLDNKADINAIDNVGWTALMIASQVQTKEVVELLLKNSANPNPKSENTPPILELAKSMNMRALQIF